MVIGALFRLDSQTIWETPAAAQKWCVLGCFGYHGNLLAFFGFWCVACQILYVGTLGQDWKVPSRWLMIFVLQWNGIFWCMFDGKEAVPVENINLQHWLWNGCDKDQRYHLRRIWYTSLISCEDLLIVTHVVNRFFFRLLWEWPQHEVSERITMVSTLWIRSIQVPSLSVITCVVLENESEHSDQPWKREWTLDP